MEAANTAESTFLKSLDLNENGKLDVGATGDGKTETQESAAVKALINPAVASPAKVFYDNANSTVDLAATSTAAQQASAYAAARAVAQNKVDTQQAVVDAAQKVVTDLDDAADVAAYTAAKTAATASEKTLDAANLSLVEAVTVFALDNHTGLNATVVDLADLNGNNVVATTSKVTYDNDDKGGNSEVDLIVWDATLNAGKGAFKLATTVTDAAVGQAADSAAVKLVAEATVVLTAVQAAYDANVADAKADGAVTTTAAAVGSGSNAANGYGAVDTLIDKQADLADEVKAAATLDTVIADLEAAYTLNADLTTLEKAVKTAEKAFATAGWDLNDVAAGANNQDIWLAESADFTITAFGAGDLLFVDAAYSLVTLTTGQTLASNLGDSTKLEVFWDAANSKLYIEEQAFAGNSAATATADTVVVTLTGVTVDLEMANGFVQLA